MSTELEGLNLKNIFNLIFNIFKRTARGFNKGTAISFSLSSENSLFEQIRKEVDERSKIMFFNLN